MIYFCRLKKGNKMKFFRFLLLIGLLFSGLFGVDTAYDQVLKNDSWKEKAKIKLIDNTDDTYSISTSSSQSIGGQNFIFPFGEQLAGKKYDDVSVQFQYNYLDTQFDVVTSTDGVGASVGASNSLAFAITSDINETSWIRSKDSIRYRPGHSGFIDFTISADTNTGYVHAGGFDTNMENGFCVEIENNEMKFGFFQDGVKKGSNYELGFDDVNTSGIHLENLNIYRIVFGYLGVKNPVLYTTQNGIWKKLHEVQTEGKGNQTHTETPVFPMTIMAHNGATVRSGSWNGGVIGNGSTVGNRFFHFPRDILQDGASANQGEMILDGTNVGTIVVFNSKDTFKSKANNIKARLTGYKFEVDIPTGNVYGDVIFQLVGVQTLSGVPTYSDINTNSSIIRYDHNSSLGASVDVTSGVVIAESSISYLGSSKGGSSSTAVFDAEKIGAFSYAGDTFAVIAKDKNGNNVTVRVILSWEELF